MDEYPIIVLNYDDVLWKQKSTVDILRFVIWSITFINKFRHPLPPHGTTFKLQIHKILPQEKF